MKNLFYAICLSVIALVVVSCSKDEVIKIPLQDKVKIAEKTLTSGEILSIYSDKSLSVGYHKLYFQLTQDGQPIKNDNLSFSTLMDMGTMKHASPFGALAYSGDLKAYESFAVFTMPTGESGSWTLEVKLGEDTESIPVEIKAATEGNALVKTVTAKDGKRYVLALVEPSSPKVGFNDLHLMVFLRESMFSFPPVSDLVMEFRPEMTSMDHGSPNNVNPISVGNGLYKGKANFTMTGDWRLFFNVSTADQVVLMEDAYLDILF